MNTEIQTIESNDAQSTMMALISKAATSDSIDADKLEKLLAVQERWEANQAKKAYGRAMADFRASVGRIKKTRQAHNSQYAGLAETIDAVKNVLAENGLSHSWRTEQDGNAVSVTCIISHVDGHSEKTSLASSPDTSGSKNSIQAIGSAVSYLQRYTLFSILGLASGDQDDDGAGTAANLIDDGEISNIVALMDEVIPQQADRERFTKWLIDTHRVTGGKVDQIPSAKYAVVVKALERKRGS